MTPALSFVGVHVFAAGVQQQGRGSEVITLLRQAIHAYRKQHPEEDFPLLHHKEETLALRFQAICYAPLFGIGKLTEFDVKEHPLLTLQGRSYHSSTLTQFLGQLERIDAAEVLRPALLPPNAGTLSYGAGHMLASWSRVPMHKGQITMLGRSMAGSQAVVAHNEAGYALFVAYYPPDLHLSQVIVEYCHQVAMATGSALFVIDRAVKAVAMAWAFEAHGLGWLCMLDDNEHAGLASCAATLVDTLADGTKVYRGPWHVPRPDEPRHFVIVEPTEGKTLGYWGTPQVKATLAAPAWPRVYRARNEIQENSFKPMIDHGALNTNYGRKKMMGADRHQQRARAKLDQALESAQQRVDKQTNQVKTPQDKVAESARKGHQKRLAQRQRAWAGLEQELKAAQHKHAKLAAQASALGLPRERADRDFRQQTIMTFRTLLLENALTSFMAMLLARLKTKVSLDCLLRLLFERSGSRVETGSQIIYGVKTAGVSASYHRLLVEVVEGLDAMDLRYQGKPIHVRLKAIPL